MGTLNEQIAAKTESIVEKLQIMYDSLKGGDGGDKNLIEQVCERSFTQVQIPNGVTKIGDYAFSSCDKLTMVTFPDSVENIGASAFGNCKKLTSINLPDKVTVIKPYVFTECEALESVYLSSNVTEIDVGAFEGCVSLKNISLGNKIKILGQLSFASSGLTNITIPASVTTISGAAFYDCKDLTSVVFEEVSGWQFTTDYGLTYEDMDPSWFTDSKAVAQMLTSLEASYIHLQRVT